MSRARRPFQARPRHPITGKRVRISAPTKRELEARLHELDTVRRELKSARVDGVERAEIERRMRRMQHGTITLERAARAYLERTDIAPSTGENVRSFLASAGETLLACELAELDAPRLDKWIELLKRTRAPSTVTLAWRTLRSIFAHAALRGWIGAPPWGVWRPRIKRDHARDRRDAARDPFELARLFAAARDMDEELLSSGAPEVADLEVKIACAALLGLRRGELAGLCWPDINEHAGQVTIARQYVRGVLRPPKGGRVVTLRAGPDLFERLAVHKARLMAAGLWSPRGPVFPSPAMSTPLRPRPFASGEVLAPERVRAAVARAGLPDPEAWTTHSLRDTFISLEERGHPGDLSALAARSRHVSLTALSRYLRAASREPPPPGFELPPPAAPPPKKLAR